MAKSASKKVIVTNAGALTRKYGKAGVQSIRAELKKWAEADEKNYGLDVTVVYLDDARSMKPYGTAVSKPLDPRQNKSAIDQVYLKELPDYLTILGAADVVPYQAPDNPVYDPKKKDGDTDRSALGDLAYACDAAYSEDIRKFLGPTRVVGRVPDLACVADGEGDLKYLLNVIRAAESLKPRATPTDYFG